MRWEISLRLHRQASKRRSYRGSNFICSMAGVGGQRALVFERIDALGMEWSLDAVEGRVFEM